MMTLNVLRKRCTKCGVEKSLVLGFYKQTSSWCKVCTNESAEAWRKGHADESKALRTRYSRKLRERVLDKLGRRCATCGFDDPRALQIDHVNNDGNVDAAKMRRARVTFFLSVLRDTDGRFQILCANCNTIKAYEHRKSQTMKEVA